MPKVRVFPIRYSYMGDERFNPLSPQFMGWDDIARLRAKPTGEFRQPEAREWYLDGWFGKLAGYQTAVSLITPHYIVEIVRVDAEGNVIEVL